MALPCGGTACSKCGNCKGGASCRTMDGARKSNEVALGLTAGAVYLAPVTGGVSLIPAAAYAVTGAAVATHAAAHLCKCK
ncbi:unnamed protein product [Adineta steineri]|uniref:Uncharacterized protein n=1 Tax=Adineta steineri TaxID=433720 RepID=A0A813WYS6_9BILA|nr:unnamed protein product [Adineta steineri]CAF4205462.1 unnamed protein product [Adineta steineri]